MKILHLLTSFFLLFTSCQKELPQERITEDFNTNWKFSLEKVSSAESNNFNDSNWKNVTIPHDWSIESGYQKEGDVASSTGFVPGGIGWYRKSFLLNEGDRSKQISVQFDGVYNNSTVWINGNLLGTRPNGYISFSYDLTNYLNYDNTPNVLAVKVNRSAYVDSRWYTGSGIYRNVRLVKTAPLYVAQWGVKITTPKVESTSAEINIKTQLIDKNPIEGKQISITYNIIDPNGNKVTTETKGIENLNSETVLTVANPKLWSIETPNLYLLETIVSENGNQVDNTTETFGIRTFKFDANTGFSLNGKKVKLKGVNLHHDAGAVGAAAPKAIWEYRIDRLKSIGTNAIRFAHNPHSPELLEVCDEKGILVMNEAFDEWYNPKGKSKVYLGDNAASGASKKGKKVIDPSQASQDDNLKKLTIDPSLGYPEVFNEWAERDLKDLIRRDYNHPSVIMWSIGNEIEWTFPYYSKTFYEVNKVSGYFTVPVYDPKKIKPILVKNNNGKNELTSVAKKLVKWVEEEDTTRPTTCGSTLPSIGMVEGYGAEVGVYGLNYCHVQYDEFHKTYPNSKILGAENWGTYSEWREVVNKDFVAGIFCWTGFAYLGEAGPWPRKGLNISFFDFAGFKTPRGHFYETLWVEKPKVYMVTTAAKESEFSLQNGEWKFDMQFTPPPVWDKLRLWEWYKVNEKWSYTKDEPIIVQTYTNCEEAELFLNGTSLGKQKLADVMEDDHILKWLVPYADGELKVIGYNSGQKVDEYILKSQQQFSEIRIKTSKETIAANGYDVAVVKVELVDKNGTVLTDSDKEVTFEIIGEGKNIGVDNGWEMNVQPHKTNTLKTHNGKAVVFVQSTQKSGNITVRATTKSLSATINLQSK